jgi:hypothetical protein
MRWAIRDSVWANKPTHTIEVEITPAAPPDRDEVEGFLTAIEPFLSKGAISAVVLNGTALRPAGNVVSYPELALPVRYAAARCRSAASAPGRGRSAQREIGATPIGASRPGGDEGRTGERPADNGGAASLLADSGLGA